MWTFCAFNNLENKHTLYHGKVEKVEKVLWIYKRSLEKYNWLWNEENVIVNKRRIKLTSRCKSMLYLRKKNLTKAH